MAEWLKAAVLKTHYGRVAEWSIAAVLKTADAQASVGSNPTPSAKHFKRLASIYATSLHPATMPLRGGKSRR